MAVVINTNVAATTAANNFTASNTSLQKSLSRLSSGNRITTPADDAGGLAVSMKISAAIARTEAVQDNLGNATSFLETQDGALETMASILDRMSELTTLYNDVTKSSSDKANYDTEFKQLQSQLSSIQQEGFNGVSLFGTAANDTLSVNIAEDGTRTVDISQAYLQGDSGFASIINTSNSLNDGNAISLAAITSAIQAVATARAENGATSSRLSFASEMLTVNKSNLEAANSRIVDVDVAEESTAYAKYQILVQSGAAMLAQANASSQVALSLIGG